MGIRENDNQLYVASFMTLLRKYQKRAVVPLFTDFLDEVYEVCNVKAQKGPLEQRILLLQSLVMESECNKDICKDSLNIESACSIGKKLIIADLTDPLLSKSEVNGMFQVMTDQFR